MSNERAEIMQTLSDLHKDAYGFRPSGSFWDRAWAMTLDELQDLATNLQKEVEASMVNEAASALRAQRGFEKTVAEIIETGAGDRPTAIRWLVSGQGEDFTEHQGVEHALWNFGLDFSIMDQYFVEIGFTRKGMVWIFQE